jgi:hypothetical protein
MAQLPSGVSKRTVQDNLRLLLELGLVDRQGERRWARWLLKGLPADVQRKRARDVHRRA